MLTVDTKQAEGEATSLARQSQTVSAAAATITITSDSEYEQAAQLLLSLKDQIKAVDEKRKEFTQPLYDLQRKINAFFKGPLDDYKQAEQALKAAMTRYYTQKEEARQKALQEAQAAAKAQEKETFTEKMTIAADNAAPVAAGTHTRQVVRWEVTDAGKLPRHYLKPDERLIDDTIKELAGKGIEINIPGVKVWYETTVVAHGRR